MIAMNSQPIITKNTIHGNQCIGLYYRDVSGGECGENHLKDNMIELVVEQKNEMLKNIDKENHAEGDIRIPQNFICGIF